MTENKYLLQKASNFKRIFARFFPVLTALILAGLLMTGCSGASPGSGQNTSAVSLLPDQSEPDAHLRESAANESNSGASGDAAADNILRFHVIDVGQGLSVLAESDGHFLLYDGGDRSASSAVVAYLKKQGVKSLDYIITSHYDADHINGLVGALNVFPVQRIMGPGYEASSKVYQSLISAAESQGLAMEHPEQGNYYRLGNASFQILSQDDSSRDGNNRSIAIMLINGNNRFLLTGDNESSGEEALLSSGLDLSCDVYVAGHHGSASSTSWDLLGKAVPEYAVISCGTGNSYGHPHAETMEKLEAMEIQVLRTDLQGDLLLVSDGTSVTCTPAPCNNYTPGDPDDIPPSLQSSEEADEDNSAVQSSGTSSEQEQSYVLNTNTRKFHLPSCSSAEDILPANRQDYTGTRDELIAQGYAPCGRCKP